MSFKILISTLYYFIESEKIEEFAKSNENDEKTPDEENIQSSVSAVRTETKGEVTLDSKTGNINTRCLAFRNSQTSIRYSICTPVPCRRT